MLTASDVMTRDPITLNETDTLEAARETFEDRQIRHLPVMRGRRLVGIVSQTDLAEAWPHHGERPAADVLLKDVMTQEVLSVQADTPLREVIELLLEERIGSLLVTDARGELAGIVTATDLVKMAKQHAEDEDLRALAAEYEP